MIVSEVSYVMSALYDIPLYDIFEELRDETLIIKWIESNNDTFIRNINIGNKDGKTALHYAIKYCYADIFNRCINDGVDVNSKDNRDFTPLFYSISFCQSFVKPLIKAGADVNVIISCNAYTPLYYAIRNINTFKVHVKTIMTLIKAGADVNVINPYNGYTPLYFVICDTNRDITMFKEHVKIIMTLIKAGANVNYVHIYDKNSALDYVMRLDYIDNDIDRNNIDRNNYIKFIKLLLNALMY